MIIYLFENDNNNASVVYDETTLTETMVNKKMVIFD